ncbi:hypothetical protein B7P43_G03268 [Cryptotermes secundus]|uniref:Set2 Rpb1 interacting domain-containing protein n=1 Tax=Cryptotermes secundus TaxID=105785 RepID=A0A2J7PII2_9NEOP|nr:uncharacterized protein LOC111873753 [Cryptotermes secundus]XP_023724465.1 uncharacterized protein LOC111873753 [Cryptotermes secundus]XP_023724466.1 uncharacterized protein LOC111873753 [Cryptotermes secundus]XP_023724467.1 uncharacterized protein LOC111873753 [Cryptotermes secundus]XP_033611096.1 uncharacterized protein LOC111873753 [Cryptotermes secundus]PNF16122.1 hypothetical protein B7P43_G03268 [Cryptotermes secundus]PNF16123.1 hypothetical protein B7P43_G03268 [Cryptotermes secundu
MESSAKKKETSSFDENELEEQIVIHLKQMVQDDDEEEEEENWTGETVTHLTGKVRACYLKHLEKILMKNYEICSQKNCAEYRFSREDVIKCAVQMERKALRSCMVVILYQRAMTRLAADIKKHTEQLKLYKKLKDCVTDGPLWSDKTTQVDGHSGYIDKTTQTDFVFMGTEEVTAESHNSQTEKETEMSLSSPTGQCFQPLSVKTEPQTPEADNEEPVQGVPIPVYVSGMIATAVRSTDYFPFNGVEPMPYYETNQEFVPNVNTDNLFQCPIVSNESTVQVNHNGAKTETFISEKDINPEEPYEWSNIEEQSSLNVGSVASSKPFLTVRRLSDLQQNENLSNGTLCGDKLSDLDLEECSRMNIDDRISAILRRETHHFSGGEHLQLEETVNEDDGEPSIWTVEKCHQQNLLRAKIYETCFNVRKRGRMRLRFLELFGSDSEDCFDVDEHVTNFRDKIARWVVERLMPYYREGRIQSRPLFKFLARHIADTLLLKNHVPDEADVEKSVMDFFSHHDMIESEDDIWL